APLTVALVAAGDALVGGEAVRLVYTVDHLVLVVVHALGVGLAPLSAPALAQLAVRRGHELAEGEAREAEAAEQEDEHVGPLLDVARAGGDLVGLALQVGQLRPQRLPRELPPLEPHRAV